MRNTKSGYLSLACAAALLLVSSVADMPVAQAAGSGGLAGSNAPASTGSSTSGNNAGLPPASKPSNGQNPAAVPGTRNPSEASKPSSSSGANTGSSSSKPNYGQNPAVSPGARNSSEVASSSGKNAGSPPASKPSNGQNPAALPGARNPSEAPKPSGSSGTNSRSNGAERDDIAKTNANTGSATPTRKPEFQTLTPKRNANSEVGSGSSSREPASKSPAQTPRASASPESTSKSGSPNTASTPLKDRNVAGSPSASSNNQTAQSKSSNSKSDANSKLASRNDQKTDSKSGSSPNSKLANKTVEAVNSTIPANSTTKDLNNSTNVSRNTTLPQDSRQNITDPIRGQPVQPIVITNNFKFEVPSNGITIITNAQNQPCNCQNVCTSTGCVIRNLDTKKEEPLPPPSAQSPSKPPTANSTQPQSPGTGTLLRNITTTRRIRTTSEVVKSRKFSMVIEENGGCVFTRNDGTKCPACERICSNGKQCFIRDGQNGTPDRVLPPTRRTEDFGSNRNDQVAVRRNDQTTVGGNTNFGRNTNDQTTADGNTNFGRNTNGRITVPSGGDNGRNTNSGGRFERDEQLPGGDNTNLGGGGRSRRVTIDVDEQTKEVETNEEEITTTETMQFAEGIRRRGCSREDKSCFVAAKDLTNPASLVGCTIAQGTILKAEISNTTTETSSDTIIEGASAKAGRCRPMQLTVASSSRNATTNSTKTEKTLSNTIQSAGANSSLINGFGAASNGSLNGTNSSTLAVGNTTNSTTASNSANSTAATNLTTSAAGTNSTNSVAATNLTTSAAASNSTPSAQFNLEEFILNAQQSSMSAQSISEASIFAEKAVKTGQANVISMCIAEPLEKEQPKLANSTVQNSTQTLQQANATAQNVSIKAQSDLDTDEEAPTDLSQLSASWEILKPLFEKSLNLQKEASKE